MARDIFISYRRKIEGIDNEYAELIKSYLKEYGINAFFDKHDMKNGNFEKNLEKNIKECNNFLLLLTKDIFAKRDTKDILREEIITAVRLNKNIIAIMFNGYNPSIDLSDEAPEIAQLSKYDIITFNNIDKNHRDATIKSIIERMKDEFGEPYNPNKLKKNNYYSNHTMTEEDLLWITTNVEVCMELTTKVFLKMFNEDVLRNKKEINLFCVATYDVDTYKNKYSYLEQQIKEKIGNEQFKINVYGFCHDNFLDYANEVFGVNHFYDCFDENQYRAILKEIIKVNNIKGFDIIDFSLVLKDLTYPEKVMKVFTEFLTNGEGFLYTMDLDDGFVNAYEDKEGYITKMLEYMKLDTGAGNRHTGRKIYTFLKRLCNKVYIEEENVSTVNKKRQFKQDLLDSYFSYLKPEMKALAEEFPDNDDYIDAYNWINAHYGDIESKFSSKEFYFRAGYIFGYGYYQEEEE